MKVEGYASFGGRHTDSAAVRNLLAHEGVLDPRTHQPLSEAAVLGLGGGISAGISFCPSVPRYGLGGGVTLVGRHLLFTFDGTFHKAVLSRLGVAFDAAEASSPKAGTKKLAEQLAAGKPALVWCARILPYQGDESGAALMAMCAWSLVVHAFDEDRAVVSVADLAPGSIEVPLEALEKARGAICTHKNRLLVLKGMEKGPRPLSASHLCDAFIDGMRSCVDGQRKPRIKTFSLLGLQDLARTIPSFRSKQGWFQCFPDGKLFWPLKESFLSIEGESTGGALFRTLWAEFLDEAAELLKKPALQGCAKSWRALGQQWIDFGEAALPDRVPAFRKTKQLIRKRRELFMSKGQAGFADMDKVQLELRRIEKQVLEDSPLDADASQELLIDLGKRLTALCEAEKSAFDALAKAVA